MSKRLNESRQEIESYLPVPPYNPVPMVLKSCLKKVEAGSTHHKTVRFFDDISLTVSVEESASSLELRAAQEKYGKEFRFRKVSRGMGVLLNRPSELELQSGQEQGRVSEQDLARYEDVDRDLAEDISEDEKAHNHGIVSTVGYSNERNMSKPDNIIVHTTEPEQSNKVHSNPAPQTKGNVSVPDF